jgi:hypothetical protein
MAHRKFPKFFLALAMLALPLSPARSQETGSFSGTVVLDKAVPLAGAKVHYNNIREVGADSRGKLRPRGRLVSATVVSERDGTFTVRGVPPGTYVLCAFGTQANHLRSCDWGTANAVVNVGAGSAASAVTLDVRTGTTVLLRVSDPAGRIRLQDPTGINARQTNLGIGVVSTMGHYFANLVEHSGTQWTYAVAVPIGVPVSLWLDTPLEVVDRNVKSVARRSTSFPILAADSSGVTVDLAVQ